MLKAVTIALPFVFVAGLASADTVGYAFRGTAEITTNLNGLSCTLKGSGAGSVPSGCNYSIGVDPEAGKWSLSLTAGNDVCTQSQTSDGGTACQFN
ncbi:hypothetical protein [Rhizobium halophytocola]|uniref:Uncharacterized protein n=1 Tax=Rhizobium halophytocola TaxID=735519 RepID=A0ABS4E5P1_9HYPH|nr:hypothetical protein [Rhizobium halophytocola]MBP1853263.1 hypothetical protein [Rhizobium halophytocola]